MTPGLVSPSAHLPPALPLHLGRDGHRSGVDPGEAGTPLWKGSRPCGLGSGAGSQIVTMTGGRLVMAYPPSMIPQRGLREVHPVSGAMRTVTNPAQDQGRKCSIRPGTASTPGESR